MFSCHPTATPLVVRFLAACLPLAGLLAPTPARAQAAEPKPPEKLYELRLYTANDGKLPALHARFRDHTLGLFEKHGMENIIYWTVSEGAAGDDAKNMLVYIIAHKDRAAADASWAAFRADPEWQAVLRKSEEGGKILAKDPVSVFMTPTAFSPPPETPNGKTDTPARLFELRKYNTGEAGLPGTVDRFKAGEAALFPKNNMPTLGFWTADDKSAFIYLLSHKDRETSRQSWQGFFTDFRKFTAEYNAGRATRPAATAQPPTRPAAGGGRGAGGGNEIRFLVPTDYSPRK